MKIIDLTGQKFGKLTVLSKGDNDTHGRCRWNCICECGKVTVVQSGNLRTGHTQSCGCNISIAVIARNHRHGYTKVKKIRAVEYNIWAGMKRRCYSKNNPAFVNYGGRGIKVCDRWANSFANFLSDMGERPSKKYSLDRIDNDGDYSPENCRWATRIQQANNCRQNRPIEINGVIKNYFQWLNHYNISHSTVRNRVNRGWPIEKAISSPIIEHHRRHN